jgi:hypothetical protein
MPRDNQEIAAFYKRLSSVTADLTLYASAYCARLLMPSKSKGKKSSAADPSSTTPSQATSASKRKPATNWTKNLDDLLIDHFLAHRPKMTDGGGFPAAVRNALAEKLNKHEDQSTDPLLRKDANNIKSRWDAVSDLFVPIHSSNDCPASQAIHGYLQAYGDVGRSHL